MGEIRQYIFSLICVAVICGLLQMLFTGSTQSIVKFVSGLMVTIVAVTPIMDGEFILEPNWDDISFDSKLVIAEGEAVAQKALRSHIKEGAETYILGKAESLGAGITVDVELENSSVPKPISIMIQGEVSPYVKQKLSDYIQRDLGVNEEYQRWIS